MGLAVEVGILAEFWEDDLKDLEGYKYYVNQFRLLNQYLQRVDLPVHHEPEACESWGCDMYGYSGLHYLRRIAAHLDFMGKLPSPGSKESLEEVSQDYYKFSEEMLNGDSSTLLGHKPKYKLSFNHLVNHTDVTGYYLPIAFKSVLHPNPEWGIAGDIGSSIGLLTECERFATVLEIPPTINENSDELMKAADLQGQSSVKWQKYGIESFTCVCLIKACKKSLQTGAAVVFA